MKVKLNDSIRELISCKRKELNLNQKTIANEIGISHQSYQRIESGVNKSCSKDVLKKICDVLDINYSNITVDKTVQKSYRLPDEIISNISVIRKKYNFTSDTETLIFIMDDYFMTDRFKSVRTEMEEMVEDIILRTFVKEMKKMKREIDKYEQVLKMISEKEHINTFQYVSEYELEYFQKKHNERM